MGVELHGRRKSNIVPSMMAWGLNYVTTQVDEMRAGMESGVREGATSSNLAPKKHAKAKLTSKTMTPTTVRSARLLVCVTTE